jgi:iron-sulfur cluster repair protein YtfE (RIC family)
MQWKRARDMEERMANEAAILRPAKRACLATGVAHPIAVLRAGHADHAGTIAPIRKPTPGLTPHGRAWGSWGARHGGTRTLPEGPVAHVAPKNDVPFPRSGPAG